ncbi:MAG: HAMP domain-containing protein [Limnochordaceae bacterium]|nr:HAMP domain-containing protein [Limnochordaceae bacterium]
MNRQSFVAGRWLRPSERLSFLDRVNLRLRLALLYGLVTTLLLVAFGVGLYSTLERLALADQADLLAANARAVATDLEIHDGILRWHSPTTSWTPGMLVALYDADGRLIGRTPTPAPAEELLFPSRLQLGEVASSDPRIAGTLTTREVLHPPDQGEWMRVTLPLTGALGEERAAVGRSDVSVTVIGYLQVARSLEPVEATLHRLLVLLLTLIPLAVVGASVGGYFLAGRALRPIDAMVDTAEQIDRENLSQRLPEPRTNDEVARLARTFNRLLERLEEGFRRERQFTADASHELRTPTAVILAQAQAARARERSAGEYERTLDTIAAEAQHMSRLLDQLLFLARADAGVDVLERERIDVAELAESVTAQMQESAARRGITLQFVPPGPELKEAATTAMPAPMPKSSQTTVSLPPPTSMSKSSQTPTLFPTPPSVPASIPALTTWVMGDQTRLMQVFLNLIDNALRYCPRGSHVRVQVRAKEGWVVAEVADDGPGIPSQHLSHLFERFYRLDQARSRRRLPRTVGDGAGARATVKDVGERAGMRGGMGEGTGTDVGLPAGPGEHVGVATDSDMDSGPGSGLGTGTGLGLAIVRSIVNAHDGHVEVESTVGQGTTFRVFLPALTSHSLTRDS